MNIASANQMTGVMSTSQANQSNQDSHEKNIQNQIVNLQGKMRDLAYNTEMSTDEKSDKKKKLQEQIQNLNSELKQYQIQKRREEAEKRQNETEKSDENIKSSSSNKAAVKETAVLNMNDSADNSAGNNNISDTENRRDIDSQVNEDEPEFGFNGAESEIMVSLSNTKKQFANMEKIQTNLTGLMRTAETDEEKIKLQKKIDSISNIIEDKAKKTADKLEESREEDKKKKEKIRKILKEQEERRANMKAAVPKSGKSAFEDNEYGKVLLTRRKS